MKSKYFVAIMFILLIGLVSAGFGVGDKLHSITKTYSSGENVKGWANISLSNEPTNSMFEDSFGNSISLIDLIKENSGFNYSCDILDCLSDYTATNGEASKSMGLTDEDFKLIGIKFDVNLASVNSVNFTIESNAEESCFNQLKVDLLNDGKVDVKNEKVFDEVCPQFKRYGCFDSNSQNLAEGDLGSTPYCQKIRLSESPGFKLGAWVKKTGTGSETLRMALYGIYGKI